MFVGSEGPPYIECRGSVAGLQTWRSASVYRHLVQHYLKLRSCFSLMSITSVELVLNNRQ